VTSPVALTNPLQANAAFLRTSLLPGLLRNVAHNLNHGLESVHLFEIGSCFSRDRRSPTRGRAWGSSRPAGGCPRTGACLAAPPTCFDARGAVELLGDLPGVSPLAFSSDEFRSWRRGARFRSGARGASWASSARSGRSLLERYGIDQAVFGGEIELAELERRQGTVRRYRPLPGYPPVRRDLAIVTGPGTTFEAIERTIRAHSAVPVAEVQAFDLYRGRGVPDGCASLGVQVVFQHPERTLLAREVQESIEAITGALRRELRIELRGVDPE